jgi:hypothetical protein
VAVVVLGANLMGLIASLSLPCIDSRHASAACIRAQHAVVVDAAVIVTVKVAVAITANPDPRLDLPGIWDVALAGVTPGIWAGVTPGIWAGFRARISRGFRQTTVIETYFV